MWDKPLYKLPSVGTTGKQKQEDSFSSIWLVQMSFSAQGNIYGSPAEMKNIWTKPYSSLIKGVIRSCILLYVCVCVHACKYSCVYTHTHMHMHVCTTINTTLLLFSKFWPKLVILIYFCWKIWQSFWLKLNLPPFWGSSWCHCLNPEARWIFLDIWASVYVEI